MPPSFEGLRVLALESRRASELAALITSHGGHPIVAPAMREVPLESNTQAADFARTLIRDGFDVVILLTGVGTRALLDVVDRAGLRGEFLAALRNTRVVVRGPKPLAVLREIDVPVWVAAPEPNTWREILSALDAKRDDYSLEGARVAVQEYGVSNTDLLDALRDRGAQLTTVPVYKWALPEDVEPLTQAIGAIADGRVDVVLFTTGVQVAHLYQMASTLGREPELHAGLRRTLIASIGPSTTEELQRRGLAADLEPSHPKMGFLVREAAEQAAGLLRAKRGTA